MLPAANIACKIRSSALRLKGCVMIACCALTYPTIACSEALTRHPIVVYDSEQYASTPVFLECSKIYSADNIPKGLDQRISSLMLRKGHQAVIGVEVDGIGLSKTLIANDPASYEILHQDRTIRIERVFRKTKPSLLVYPDNEAIMRHIVYLKLAEPLVEGEAYRIRFPYLRACPTGKGFWLRHFFEKTYLCSF